MSNLVLFSIPAFVIALLFPHLWYLGLIWTLGVWMILRPI